MKKAMIFVSGICAFGYVACSGNASGMSDEDALRYADSMRAADSVEALTYVENVLNLNSEEELIRKYGAGSISYDTIWGAEGYFTMGTYLRTDEQTHIEIMWLDSAAKSGMISATLVSDMDYFTEKLEPGAWKSSTGAYIGMSVDELQKLNGRPFKFSGFGWDYGGGVMSWEGGTLEGKGIAIQLSEGTNADLKQEEINQVLGDITVLSSNTVLKKLNPRVWSISVATVK